MVFGLGPGALGRAPWRCQPFWNLAAIGYSLIWTAAPTPVWIGFSFIFSAA
jgi:hypothetical protein